MDRRSFLRAGALASLATSAPWIFRGAMAPAAAQTPTYGGPYWIFVHAGGGWDPQFMFDPTDNPEFNRLYAAPAKEGNISYAPIEVDYDRLQWNPDVGIAEHVRTAQQFLKSHGARLTVINGIDTRTNDHKGGSRAMASGQLPVGYPALGALVAATHARTMPMAFFSAGGYDVTGDLVPLTRISNSGALSRIARPNEINAGAADTALYHTQETMARVQRFQQARLQAQLDSQYLPNLRRAMGELLDARASTAVLDRIQMPNEVVDLGPGELNGQESFMRSAQALVAVFKSGLSAAGTLQMSGFDTHGNHHRDQCRRILQLFGGLDYLISEVERAGLSDQVYIVVTSDFGRGPHYNGTNESAGKDHWPITSMFAWGPNIQGNRVVGATDEQQLARSLSPDSLQPDDQGIRLGPAQVHLALRQLVGVQAELQTQYPLAGEPLPLFG